MNDHLMIKNEFVFHDYLEVPVNGRSGGVVLMWLTNMVNITRKRQSGHELHSMIHELPNNLS